MNKLKKINFDNNNEIVVINTIEEFIDFLSQYKEYNKTYINNNYNSVCSKYRITTTGLTSAHILQIPPNHVKCYLPTNQAGSNDCLMVYVAKDLYKKELKISKFIEDRHSFYETELVKN